MQAGRAMMSFVIGMAFAPMALAQPPDFIPPGHRYEYVGGSSSPEQLPGQAQDQQQGQQQGQLQVV